MRSHLGTHPLSLSLFHWLSLSLSLSLCLILQMHSQLPVDSVVSLAKGWQQRRDDVLRTIEALHSAKQRCLGMMTMLVKLTLICR